MLTKIWTDFIALIFKRPARSQVAALCWRQSPTGLEVLLITSRESKRWVLPKGWPKKGRSLAQTAVEEAWEEAGVRLASAGAALIGRYRYEKRLASNLPVETLVDVYAVQAASLADEYPEQDQRQRAWFSPEKAAELVDEPELAQILRDNLQSVASPKIKQPHLD